MNFIPTYAVNNARFEILERGSPLKILNFNAVYFRSQCSKFLRYLCNAPGGVLCNTIPYHSKTGPSCAHANSPSSLILLLSSSTPENQEVSLRRMSPGHNAESTDTIRHNSEFFLGDDVHTTKLMITINPGRFANLSSETFSQYPASHIA